MKAPPGQNPNAMTQQELDRLARTVFRHLAENVPSWGEIPIAPDTPEDLTQAAGYKRWRRAKFQKGEADSRYEANRRLIMDAGRHLEDMGYQTTSIRSPKPDYISVRPDYISVRVANAGSWRLCARIPEDAAGRIIVLGFLPSLR